MTRMAAFQAAARRHLALLRQLDAARDAGLVPLPVRAAFQELLSEHRPDVDYYERSPGHCSQPGHVENCPCADTYTYCCLKCVVSMAYEEFEPLPCPVVTPIATALAQLVPEVTA